MSVCQGKSVPLRYVSKTTHRVTRLSFDTRRVNASSSSTLLQTQGNLLLPGFKHDCSLLRTMLKSLGLKTLIEPVCVKIALSSLLSCNGSILSEFQFKESKTEPQYSVIKVPSLVFPPAEYLWFLFSITGHLVDGCHIAEKDEPAFHTGNCDM